MVSLSLDLVAAGYEALAPVMEEPARLRQWLSRPFTDRLAAALDMAAEHAACEAISFIHADINLENVLDVDHGRMSLIDFDSGWLPGAPGSGPLVWGKPDDFIAPEAKRRGGQVDASAIGVLSERWAMGFLLHYVLFGSARSSSSPASPSSASPCTWPITPGPTSTSTRPCSTSRTGPSTATI